eukprot:TRINITY_DN671_c0_g1_i1.p1 TRINITY_DN671_c0_g1~~TRINITY_DN671_c0_g1_i1.p1  ORF type:complete len:179 (+),score=58.17 TRINITY_DN671_c0_g1_i1:595-1131(+)
MFGFKLLVKSNVRSYLVLSRQSFHTNPILFKQPDWEKHLKKQAAQLGLPKDMPLPEMREQVKELLKARLAAVGWGTDGTPKQLRERIRQSECLFKAKELGIDYKRDFNTVKQDVLDHFRNKLVALGRSPKGSLKALEERLSKVTMPPKPKEAKPAKDAKDKKPKAPAKNQKKKKTEAQ